MSWPIAEGGRGSNAHGEGSSNEIMLEDRNDVKERLFTDLQERETFLLIYFLCEIKYLFWKLVVFLLGSL